MSELRGEGCHVRAFFVTPDDAPLPEAVKQMGKELRRVGILSACGARAALLP